MNARPPAPRLSARYASLGCTALLLLAGCRQDLNTFYGQRSGAMAQGSVNGTGALGEMFEQRGHTVFSWSSLSPKLQKRADVIVWFPDDFKPPSPLVRHWLENWLDGAPGRTLIYVGRDFDAAPWYWATAAPLAPASQKLEYQSRETWAQTMFDAQRGTPPKSEDCDWFTLEGQAKSRKVTTLQGEPDWLDSVDPTKAALELRSRLVPPDDAEVLLRSEQDVLVSRQWLHNNPLIVVANGSFLLNAMLVNHEHRKLANQLVTEIGPAPQTVVFLESSADGPPIRKDDSMPSPGAGLEIFQIWPTNWILLHLTIVGILFCFSRYPIFGRPRELAADAPSDFGKHIDALGELFQRSGDTAYAYGRLMQYRQMKADGVAGAERSAAPVGEASGASLRSAPATPIRLQPSQLNRQSPT